MWNTFSSLIVEFNNYPNKNIIIAFIAIIFLLLFAIGFLFLQDSNTKQKTSENYVISGMLDINGVIPEGATITIKAIETTSGKEEIIIEGLLPIDGNSWSFTNAAAGKTYEIQAELILNGKNISLSSPITITAPASNEVIVINSEGDSSEEVIISVTIIANGHIPQGSTITIKGKKLGNGDFVAWQEGLPARNRQFINYRNAIAGSTYEIQGTLYSAEGASVGASEILTVAAPALNETITINSVAQVLLSPTPTPTIISLGVEAQSQTSPSPTPTPTSSEISGKIDLNGLAPANSRIVIFQRILNGTSYAVAVDDITPSDGATWTWSSPLASTWYEMFAVLKNKKSDGTDEDIATSTISSIAAPATDVTFTLNSGVTLSKPSNSISVACGSLSGNYWNATITFSAVTYAGSYWYQIGTTNGGKELANSTKNAEGTNDLKVNQNLEHGKTHYVRYAYSTMTNLLADDSNFSAFSDTKQIKCD